MESQSDNFARFILLNFIIFQLLVIHKYLFLNLHGY